MYTISSITHKHIAGFHAALDSVAKEKKYLLFEEAPALEATKNFVEENIKEAIPQYVAIVDGKVVGWCDIIPSTLPQQKHSAKLGIGIISEYRGQGIGRKLLQETIAGAKACGIKRIELGVFTHNNNAIKLYESFGFVREGVKIKSAKIDNQYFDEMLMALLIFD